MARIFGKPPTAKSRQIRHQAEDGGKEPSLDLQDLSFVASVRGLSTGNDVNHTGAVQAALPYLHP